MKKVLVSAIAVLAMAGIVNAAAIGLEWAGNTATPFSAPTAPNTPVTAQFYIETGAVQPPILTGIGLVLNAWLDAAATIPANNVVFQTSITPHVPGWIVADSNANVDLNGLQWAATGGPNYTPPAGKTYLMDITLQYTDPTPGQYYITIKRDLDPTQTSSVIFNDAGADYINDENIWITTNASTAGRGKWAFGNWGGSAWQKIDPYYGTVLDSQEVNPLILVTPEPASLALLVLGGFAALRRR